MDKKPALAEAARVWGRIGLLSFGGPAAQIAIMHKEVVQDRQWLSEQQFLNALSFCMLLPGPEAMQLATYAGWRLHGTIGGLIAGVLFVLPGAAVIMVLAAIYGTFGTVPLVEALFYGIKAAVLVIVLQALLRLAPKALVHTDHWFIAGAAFAGLFFLTVPYPIIILAAALYGWSTARAPVTESETVPDTVPDAVTDAVTDTVPHDRLDRPTASARGTARTVMIWMALWWLPLLALIPAGAPALLTEIGLFFSTLAVVTFGGAYAVLAYMAQDVVVHFGWLTAREMIDALGLAETTPGPLILVTQFVGFLAGFKDGGLGLGIMAAMVALWTTFAPCFLWIFAGAPYVEWLSQQPRLRHALQAITAAVVGVIVNLSLWLALHVVFATVTRVQVGPLTFWLPELASVEWPAALLFALSSVLAFWLRWGVLPILLTVSAAGTALGLMVQGVAA